MSFQEKRDDFEERFWPMLTRLVTGQSKAHEERWDRLKNDFKYLRYDRGVERLLEQLQVNDPWSKSEL